MKKGQVSLEFLMITAFAFLLIIPVMLLFLTEAQGLDEDITSAQLNKLAEELVDAIDNVYYLGEPTTKTLEIYVPKHIELVTFIDNRTIYEVDTGTFAYNFTRFVATNNVSGTLNTNPGRHSIKISAVGDGVTILG
ncbi:hypothetical protein HQ533_04385 [Candidatus Woesearchaeota archaeon]|nr:hypothetical protein [Candidatus Woesearchaeota archaeon]